MDMKRLTLLLIFCVFFIDPAFAQAGAVVKEIQGKVEVREVGGSWEGARVGMKVSKGTYISTGFRSSAVIDFGTSVLLVKELTRLQLEELIEKEGTVETRLFLRVGRIKAEVKSVEGLKQVFKLRSPTTTAAVRGTEFEFDGVSVKVYDGNVLFINRVGQTRSVAAGEKSSAPGFFTPTAAEEEREASVTVISDTSKPTVGGEEGRDGTDSLIPVPPSMPTTTGVVIDIEIP